MSIEWINSKVLLYNTGNHIQYPVITHNGKKYKKECICVYIYVREVKVAQSCPTL